MRIQVLKNIVGRSEMLTATDICNPNISVTRRVSRRSSGSILAIRRTGQPRNRGSTTCRSKNITFVGSVQAGSGGPFDLYRLFLLVGKSGGSVNQTTYL